MSLAAVKHFVASMPILAAALVLSSIPTDCKTAKEAVNKFGDAVYSELATAQGNTVFSPFPVYSSLAMLSLGTNENARQELLSKLSAPNLETLKNNYRKITKHIQNVSKRDLHLVNNLFITNRHDLSEQYKSEVMSIFASKPQQVDFAKTKTADFMNAWVANQTNRTIQNIVDTHSFSKSSLLVLLNAAHFKNTWKTKFDKAETIPNYFFHTPNGTVRCNMMLMKRTIHEFHSESDILVLAPSLHKTDLKIVFISSIGGTNITELDHRVTSTMFFYLVSQLRPASLIIKIPTFKIEEKYSLKQILIAAGLTQIFQKSNFSNMFTQPASASVDQIIHKAAVEINEDGVAASSTKQKRMGSVFARVFRKFVLDKPFLFFLYDSKSEVILLRGRIEDPNQ